MSMRFLCLILCSTGCAYISDKHEDWRLDPDGDGVGIEEDCDNDDPEIGGARPWYVDQDEDGFGTDVNPTFQCDAPAGYSAEDGDCDDTDSTVFPGAAEACDQLDNNCDGVADEDLELIDLFVDADGDGFGDPETMEKACGELAGLVEDGTDCDDDNPFFHAEGAVEIPYNGIDDNCDIADGDGDADGDGHWASDYVDQVAAMGAEPAPVPEDMGDDCNDLDATIFPGADDTWYDGVDSDCGGEDDCDIDGDGFQPAEGVCTPEIADCDDHNPDRNPDATERCETDFDDNCDGDTSGVDAPDCLTFYRDLDSDGFGVTEGSVCQCEGSFPHNAVVDGDCDDGDAFTYPDAFETPLYDGIDRDCAGDDDFDMDGDGYVRDEDVGKLTIGVEGSGSLPGGDCADGDETRSPDAVEDCETPYDDDCDGSVNSEDALACSLVYPDNDGDGFGDDAGAACWCDVTDAFPVEVGDDCVDSNSAFHPDSPDYWYDTLDTDCAGNDDFDQDGDGHSDAGFGEPSETFWRFFSEDGSFEDVSVEGSLDGRLSALDCDDTDITIYPEADEFCDGLDNDCNGEIDDGALDTVLLFADVDDDGFGDSLDSVEGCSEIGRVYVDGDCDDADATIYPDAEDACDEIDQDCDGDLVEDFFDSDDDGTPDCVDPLMISEFADTTLSGPASSRTGRSLLVGSDGVLYVGATDPLWTEWGTGVYVLEDLASGEVALDESTVRLNRGSFIDDFGWSLAELVTDDGNVLLIGSPAEGRVWRVSDPLLGGIVDEASGAIFGSRYEVEDSSDSQCGAELAVDSSGPEDRIYVGCPHKAEGGYVIRDEEWTAPGTFLSMGYRIGVGIAYNERFGWSMDTADFNGDGIDDVAIGAPRDERHCAAANCGGLFVYEGPIEGSLSHLDEDYYMYGSAPDDALGDHVRAVPDLDGDGSPDLLVATDQGFSETATPGPGALLLISSADFSPTMEEGDAFGKLIGDAVWSRLGYAAEMVPDVDGDGSDDMVVSAHGMEVAGEEAGAIYGVLGPFESGTRAVADESVAIHGQPGDWLGYRMTLGDVGADGELNLLVSAHRNSRVYVLAPESIFLID
jgi:hypothetical protein